MPWVKSTVNERCRRRERRGLHARQRCEPLAQRMERLEGAYRIPVLHLRQRHQRGHHTRGSKPGFTC
jgi:hypothetical protein